MNESFHISRVLLGVVIIIEYISIVVNKNNNKYNVCILPILIMLVR